MRIQDEVAGVVKSVLEQHEIKRVIWIAAGGSFGGHWAANYVDEHCLCVLTSMRGTPETCRAAELARDRGAATIALYVQESDLTAACDHKIAYESIALDESRTERVPHRARELEHRPADRHGPSRPDRGLCKLRQGHGRL